jgi:hypothetical protein
MSRGLLPLLLLTTAAAAPQAVPFNAAIYAEFAMPYPDNGRTFDTNTLGGAGRLLDLNLALSTPAGYQRLGVWTTSRGLADPIGTSPPPW